MQMWEADFYFVSDKACTKIMNVKVYNIYGYHGL